jgi:hypothetical protein
MPAGSQRCDGRLDFTIVEMNDIGDLGLSASNVQII